MLDADSLRKLKSLRAEFTASGISALYLFGSQARGDARPDSDVDIAFDVMPEANERFSVVDQSRMQLRLQEVLGRKVDFIERRGFRRRIREQVERDLVRLL
jgi:uncharacterized protein